MKQIQLRKFFRTGPMVGLFAILIVCGGCNRAWEEWVASDSTSDIFYDVMEKDPKVGFRLLHDRWQSFKPFLFPNTSSMRSARMLSGCCLILRFWDELSEEDRLTIINEAREPDPSLVLETDDYTPERKKLILIKVQILEKGKNSLSPDQKKLWDELSANFGDRSNLQICLVA